MTGNYYMITKVYPAISDSGKIEDCHICSRTLNVSEEENLYKNGIRFKLLDGDMDVYFYGFMSEIDFSPLDYFGDEYGCVELQYFEDHTWKVL